MATDASPRHLVVAGDVLNDRHLYSGERNTPAEHDRRGVTVKSQHGGAHLLCNLIERVLANPAFKGWKALPGVEQLPLNAEPSGSDSYAIWQPFPQTKKRPKEETQGKEVWRAGRLMGYGNLPSEGFKGLAAPRPRSVPEPDILVLDDAGFLFRHEAGRPSWSVAERGSGFVILKMSEPVAQGALWGHLREHCAERLVCLVSARDLRREQLGLSRGLSWDATLGDLRLALHNHPAARELSKAKHVVVTFSGDGALWLHRTDDAEVHACLCFDPIRSEGEWETQFAGEAFGFHCAMAAALAAGIARHTDDTRDQQGSLYLPLAIEAGLLAMRDLREYGHGPVGAVPPKGYPIDRIAAKILAVHDGSVAAKERLAWIDIDWPATNNSRWSVVEASQRGGGHARLKLLDLAWNVTQRGTASLNGLPHAHFGELWTVGRTEIETLRHIRQRMNAYHDDKSPKRPLSIGVFGPPGAGKSFGVKQLSDEVFGKDSWREFNLSQFRDSQDLNGAFHQVRDLALGGLTPVIFWDEFDSRNLDWLQYLLAPMQDGRFQDGQVNHAIGKCVFIYAGGTSWSYAEFADREHDKDGHFRSAKGPDFVSRLDAHMDVLGPNQRTLVDGNGPEKKRKPDHDDISYPLRRALLIRAYLGCKADEQTDIDPYLLQALLDVGEYWHGARSLEKLIQLLRDPGKRVLRRSNLPRSGQLVMYVDAAKFGEIIEGEEVAAAIHETWRELSKKEGWRMASHFDKPYAELTQVDKEENRAAARRIPDVLAVAGLGWRRAGEGSEPALPDLEVRQIIKQYLEPMAEAEHNGWMNHRADIGWRYDPIRDDEKYLHPAMKPYADLPDKEKKKDRNSVSYYPDFAKSANYQIIRLVPKGITADPE